MRYKVANVLQLANEMIEAKREQDWGSGTEPWTTELIAALVQGIGADTYAEIGVLRGRTLARVLGVNPKLLALGVDLDPIPITHERLTPLVGDSKDVLWECDFKPDVVFVDGGHDYKTASNDIRWAKERGAKVILVHDIYCFPAVGAAVLDALSDGWTAVQLRTRPFPFYEVTGLAILTRELKRCR